MSNPTTIAHATGTITDLRDTYHRLELDAGARSRANNETRPRAVHLHAARCRELAEQLERAHLTLFTAVLAARHTPTTKETPDA